jgi:hypothetical protein
MAGDNTTNDAQGYEQVRELNPDLESLDGSVGAWEVSGPGIHGKVTFEWMEGASSLFNTLILTTAETCIRVSSTPDIIRRARL